jgi:formamidopyrimidine-DNA glycosylase
VPELPEVETVRSQLAPALAGRRFDDVRIFDARLTRPEDPDVVAAELIGERVADVRRRGKYLIFAFASGRHLLAHLRMTGGFLEPGELDDYLAARIGGEPLDDAFTTLALARALEGRRAPIKAALLDQRAVAGVGNIYADEALWRARIHPLRPARDLARKEVAELRKGIRKALELGIERQGTTFSTYRDVGGRRGRGQTALRVYGREGEPCERCGTPIEKTRVAGRGTWFCPSCQHVE